MNKHAFHPRRLSATNFFVATFMLATIASIDVAAAPVPGDVDVWLTTGDKSLLLARETGPIFSAQEPSRIDIRIDANTRYQEMVGFGASITDASAWLIQTRLSPVQRNALMSELFGPSPGIGLSLTRLTIGASDFSREHYSFDDRPHGKTDYPLAFFSIEPNRAEVLPTVKLALSINPRLKIMASPWSAPAWMKTSDSLIKGTLRPQAYQAYAEYFVRYLDAYEAEGIPMFALTVQNEPHFEPGDYPGMRLDSADRAKFIGEHLGPLLAKRPMPPRILDWDHNWDAPDAPMQVLSDPAAAKYVAGTAWHCYAGDISAQTKVHEAYPAKETYFTECSGGEWSARWDDSFAWFARTLIVGSTRGWAKGVVLWNLALDENFGPHKGGCSNCRGVVTINSKTGEITRNPEYYALAHASRFVRPGAYRIESSSGRDQLDNVAFRNVDDGSVALIVANSAMEERGFSVTQNDKSFSYRLPSRSVATFVWKP